MKINEAKARFDYWFGGSTFDESAKKNEVIAEQKVITEKKATDTKQKCPDCHHPMADCTCDEDKYKKGKKDKAKSKTGKNKMGPDASSVQTPTAAAPAATAAPVKPMAKKNAKKADKKMKESVDVMAKVVYGLREGDEVKRFFIEKPNMASAIATAKRMLKTKDLTEVSFIDVVDTKASITKTVYETLESYKSRKRLFETHVLCSECGSGDLKLSIKKTKIRCQRCGQEDLVENIDGVKKQVDKK